MEDKLQFQTAFGSRLNTWEIYSRVFLWQGEKDIYSSDTYFSGSLNYCDITFLLQRKCVLQRVYAFPVNYFGDLCLGGCSQLQLQHSCSIKVTRQCKTESCHCYGESRMETALKLGVHFYLFQKDLGCLVFKNPQLSSRRNDIRRWEKPH